MDQGECHNCKYWLKLSRDGKPLVDCRNDRLGWCQRHCPVAEGENKWPKTSSIYSCGDYEPIQSSAEYWRKSYWGIQDELMASCKQSSHLKSQIKEIRKSLINITKMPKRTTTKKFISIIEEKFKAKEQPKRESPI
jgi:hypothetical protein